MNNWILRKVLPILMVVVLAVAFSSVGCSSWKPCTKENIPVEGSY